MENTNGTKRRGRPPKDSAEVKREPISFRTTPEMRDKIVAAAERSGRSIAQEVESRLDVSFREEQVMGGADTALLVKLIASAIGLIEIETERRWTEDRMTWDAANAAIRRIVSWFQPQLDLDIWQRHCDAVMFPFMNTVFELDKTKREIEGLWQAYDATMPPEIKARYEAAMARYPAQLKEVQALARGVFEGPMREQSERTREAVKLGRQIAGERQGRRSGNFIVGGVARMFIASGSIEPLPGLRDPASITDEEMFAAVELLAGGQQSDPDMEVFRMKRTYEDLSPDEED